MKRRVRFEGGKMNIDMLKKFEEGYRLINEQHSESLRALQEQFVEMFATAQGNSKPNPEPEPELKPITLSSEQVKELSKLLGVMATAMEKLANIL
jgi:hypothetical protein